MDNAQFIYVTYIATTQEKIWEALTDPTITTKYWTCENISTWQPGARWEHRRSNKEKTLLLVGKVIDVVSPKYLVLTWADVADESIPEKHSRVTFNIEQFIDVVQLTLTHDQLEYDSEMHKNIKDGWPKVLSSLKSLMERNQPLPALW